jgi:hypothetical protein
VEDLKWAGWAGSLQDGTMQGLVALRLLLTSSIKDGSREALESAADQAVRQIDTEIAALRGLITEIRSS